MEPKASSPYRRLYGYRSEGSARTHTYTPDLHQHSTSSHTHSHIPPTHYRRLSARRGK